MTWKRPYSVDTIKMLAVPIAKEYGVARLSLFGSYARGEETAQSDLDFFIEQGAIKGLIQYYSFVDALEKQFDCHVDVVMDGSSDEALLSNIRSDEVTLYAAG